MILSIVFMGQVLYGQSSDPFIGVKLSVLEDLAVKSFKLEDYKKYTKSLENDKIIAENHLFLMEKSYDNLLKRYKYQDTIIENQQKNLNLFADRFGNLADLNRDCEKQILIMEATVRKEKTKNWILGVGAPALGIILYEVIKGIGK